MPGDIGRQVEAADSAAAVRRRAAIAAHQHAIQQHEQAPGPATAAEVERTRAEADAAHQAYTQDGRHIVGRHDAAMLRWAASITAQREQPGSEPGDRPPDTAGSRAAAAAAAAEAAIRAYGAGDLDEARRMTEEAAASDPSRESLWQQYRDQIDARRAVLASRQAYHDGGGDWQRAQELLEQTRQINPRVRGRAIWNQDLPSPTAARGERGVTDAGAANVRPGENRRQPQRERMRQTERAVPSQASSADRTRGTGEPSLDGIGAEDPDDGKDGVRGIGPGRWPAPNPRSPAPSVSPDLHVSHADQQAEGTPAEAEPVSSDDDAAVSWQGDPRATWSTGPARRSPLESAVAPPSANRAPSSAQAAIADSEHQASGATAPGKTADVMGSSGTDASGWPARNPRLKREFRPQVRRAGGRDAAETNTHAEGESAGRERGSHGVDWRDKFLRTERECWEPKPHESYSPPVLKEPRLSTAHEEIEPGQ